MVSRGLILAALIALGSAAAADPASSAPPNALAEAAATQVGVTVFYDPSYQSMSFPGGDIPRDRGVCTDVVIRALRDAHDIDLQVVVNRDMKANFAAYPTIWGLTRTDRNIDHRRVPNLETLLRRIGAADAPSSDPGDFSPGDIVSWRLSGSNLPHIGIVSTRRSTDGARPLITHNIGWGTRTEDILFDHQMVMRARLDDAARARLRQLAQ